MRTEDGSIVQECLDGEPGAFGILVDKYKEGIYAFAYDKLRNFQDAQDVTQEVFEQAYRGLRSLRYQERFAFWLYRIARNHCRKWVRTQSRRPEREFIEDQDPAILEAHSLNSYRDNQLDESLQEVLDSLPEAYHEVLTLYYFGGMSSREIAGALGTSPGAVRTRLSRARGRLKEEMVGMMDTAFEGYKLRVGFTFRIVEAVKHIKISPMPRVAGLPWGLSLAAGIIVAVLSLNPQMNMNNLASFPTVPPLPVEVRALKTGEIPVDILVGSRTVAISGKQEDIAEAFFLAETRADSDEGQVVFVRDDGIWIMDADGENQRQITFSEEDRVPTWSPDGKRIAFSRHADDKTNIYIINADGSDIRQLTEGFQPAWSPNGKQIAFYRSVWEEKADKWELLKTDVYVIGVDGANLKKLTDDDGPPFFQSPSWSPDGTKIALHALVDFAGVLMPRIWVMDADGGNRKILTPDSWGYDPVWSPDGTKIVFYSPQAGLNWNSNDIYVMDADGTNIKILTAPGPAVFGN
jgi:RNA polymerase sigma factor (sigma-70 family)